MLTRNRTVAMTLSIQLGVLLACGGEDDGLPTGRAERATGPQASSASGGTDAADTSCQVVLRSVGRRPGGNDYATRCVDGRCNYAWFGEVDVAQGAPAGTVHVLYRTPGSSDWWKVDATPAAGAQPGFVRHTFTIHEHTFGPSKAAASATQQIELIPYLARPDGSRLFDHNRLPGALDNYKLNQNNNFALSDGGACQAVFGRVTFTKSWDEHLSGTLRQGGYLVVDYDIDRLTTCRGTHNGHPAWDIVAHVRFAPGGQQVQGSVRALVTSGGVPTNAATAKALTVTIPKDATSAAIWFHNSTGAGSRCEAWDSNFGANYTYPVSPAAGDARCKDVEQWSKINSDMPYATKEHCLGYTVDEQVDATHCELHLSGIGKGYMAHYGIPQGWIEAYLEVPSQQGTLLHAGMWTRYRDPATQRTGERFTLGRHVSGPTWQTGFIHQRTGTMGTGTHHYQVEQMAFFIDVRRPSGKVVRLWQSRGGANYTINDAFSLSTSTKHIPYGNIQYANPGAPVFDAKRTCGGS